MRSHQPEKMISDIEGLSPLFQPTSIAIVGASTDPSKIGHALLKNIIAYKYTGELFVIHPNANEVLGIKTYTHLSDLPKSPDLVFLAVSSKHILALLEESGKLGCKGVVIITAGFGETSAQGQINQNQIKDIADRYQMRVIGPNVLGIVNTNPKIRLNGIFVIPKANPGPLAFISQSGALGNAVLGFANRRRLGISIFASIGNMADISFVDLLPFVAKDPQTKVIMLYVEMLPKAPKFLELARTINKTKPIIVIKAGRSTAGSRAAQSHTASLAGSDAIYDAAFRQHGIYRALGVDDMFDVAKTLAWQPPLLNTGIGIVTNSGGPGILAADAIETEGLQVADLSAKTLQIFQKKLPPVCAITNPVDLVAAAGPENYAFGLETLLNDSAVDGCVVIVTPPDLIHPEGSLKIAEAILPIALKYPKKPVIGCWMGGPSIDSAVNFLEQNNNPNFPTTIRAANALRALRFRSKSLDEIY